MAGLLDFRMDELPSLLSGDNSILWGNRRRGPGPNDGLPALWQNMPTGPTPAMQPPRSAAPMETSAISPAPPSAPAPGPLLGNYEQEEPRGGLLAGLQQGIMNPLTLAGFGLLSGEGFGGAMRGFQMGGALQDREREQAEQRRQKEMFETLLRTLNAPTDFKTIARMQGPVSGGNTLAKLLDPNRDLDRRHKEADIAYTQSRTKYYNERPVGGASGQTERIIDRLMENNPDLSYEDAVALARRAPQDDTMRLENLAMNAFRNDPSQTLEEWRAFYGLGERPGARTQPGQGAAASVRPPVPAATPSVAPPSAAPGGPPAGARQAQDGNWYLPDPDRPGKYLKVNP